MVGEEIDTIDELDRGSFRKAITGNISMNCCEGRNTQIFELSEYILSSDPVARPELS